MNETSTENPPMQTAPLSARDAWPKTTQERAIAKTLVRQCYTLSHNENEQINWKDIKSQHPELYGQLRYWSADVDIRIQQLAHEMRNAGDLPEIKRDDPTPGEGIGGRGSVTNERFIVFDTFVKGHHREFPRDDRGRIAWEGVKNSMPEFWTVCTGLWGDDFGIVRGNASGRLRQLGIYFKTPKRGTHHRNGTNGAEHDAIDKWLIKNWDNLPRQKTGGRVSWKESMTENSDLWDLLRQQWPNWNKGSYRNALNKKITALGLIWDNNPKGRGKRHTRAVVHQPIVHHSHEQPLPQVRVDQPAPPVHGANAVPFKFEACPKCYAPLALLEKMIGSSIIECPKCGFNVLLAEQGVTAAFSLPKEQQTLEQIFNQ